MILIAFAVWCGFLGFAQLSWPEAFRPPFYASTGILFLLLALTARANSRRLDMLEQSMGLPSDAQHSAQHGAAGDDRPQSVDRG